VVLAVVVMQAGHLLRRLGDAQALGRARLAGSTAAQEFDDVRHHLLTTVRLLSERPTLSALAEVGEESDLRDYLEQFRASTEISGCGVVLSDRTVVAGALQETSSPDATERADAASATIYDAAWSAVRDGSQIFWHRGEGDFVLGAATRLAGHPEA